MTLFEISAGFNRSNRLYLLACIILFATATPLKNRWLQMSSLDNGSIGFIGVGNMAKALMEGCIYQ